MTIDHWESDGPSVAVLFLKVNGTNTCGRFLHTNRTGVITSPRYPQNYPNNTDCLWRIRVRKEKIILISITSLDIEEGYDFLEVKHGRYFTISPFAGRYTGKPKLPIQLTIPSHSAWVRFSSDELVNAPGFCLTYRAQRKQSKKTISTGKSVYCLCIEQGSAAPEFLRLGMDLKRNKTVPSVVMCYLSAKKDSVWWAIVGSSA